MFGLPISENTASIMVHIVLTICITALLHVVLRNVLDRIVRRAVKEHKYVSRSEEKKREDTLQGILHTAISVVLWTIAIIVILAQLRVNLAALLTGAGLVGVLVGFGAQNAIKDYLAGIFIITENQYRVGDIITLYASGANVSGVVEDITIRITKLRDLDGNLHIVQNGSGGVVTNRSFEFANVNIDINVSYDTDLEKAREVINRVGVEQAADEQWQAVVLEPIQFLRVDSFNDFSVTLKSVGKVQPATQWELAGDFRLRLKHAFDKAGIVIPIPQVVVHQAPTKKTGPERSH